MYKLTLPIFFIFLTSTLFAQHVWERTNPGGGGAIAMVGATVDGTILAASDLSGVYKTTDNGLSWAVLGSTQGLLSTNITCFGFHPTDGNTFLIGTGEGTYKTTDGGNTIYPVNMETDPNLGIGFVESMAMDMTNGNIGYMAHHEWWRQELSLLKTNDGGENWNILTTTGLPVDARITKIIVDHNNPNLVYALTGKARYGCSEPNLYKSNNGGLGWTEIANFADILDVDLHPTDQNTIYVSTFEANDCSVPIWQYVGGDEYTGELYKSTNGGNSFTEIGDKTGIISVGTNPTHISVTDIFLPYDWNPNAGTWKTTDGGTNWNHSGLVQNWFTGWSSDSYIFSFSFNGVIKTLTKDRFKPDRLYGAFGQWAWSSIDGGSVLNNISTTSYGNGQYASTGLENIAGHCIDVSDVNSNTIYMGGYDLGFWYSRNHGESWKRSLPDNDTYPDYSWYAGGGSNCNIVLNDPARENVVWASFGANHTFTQSALFKSEQFGENWIISNTGLAPLGLTMHGLSLDVNSPIDNRTLYVTQSGNVFKSVDDGQSWSPILQVGGLKFTAVDQVNSQLVYAGGENGFWRSTDGGSNWTEVGLPEMKYIQTISGSEMRPDIVPTYDEPWNTIPIEAWQGVFEIKADPNIGGRVYVVAYGPGKGLYRSDDQGTTWKKIYSNSRMRGVAIVPSNSDIIYASSSLSYHSGGYDANSFGFKISYDAGETWSDANEGMAWTHGGSMDIESGDNPHLWAWSPGTGIQHTPIPNLPTQDVDLDQDGFVSADDCDDTNGNINPNQTEIPYNGLDDDCNAATRDDDLDQDGFVNADDCDDLNSDIYPGRLEIPDNDIDEDCDGKDDTSTSISTCAAISGNLTTSSIGDNNAYVYTPQPNGAINNQFRYRSIVSDIWIVTNISTNYYRYLSDLLSGTRYEFQVSQACGDGSYSEFSASSYFTTTSGALIEETDEFTIPLPLLQNAEPVLANRQGKVARLEKRPFLKERAITVYPNPAVSSTTIILESTQATKAKIFIVDITGSIVQSYEIALEVGRNDRTFSLVGLPSGSYFIKVDSGSDAGWPVQKLVILQQ